MINKSIKILQVTENSVAYELTITTEQVVVFVEPISELIEKRADAISNSRIQRNSINTSKEEESSLEVDQSIPVDVKNRVKDRLINLSHSFAKSIENLEQDIAVYSAAIDAHKTFKANKG